jgi:hypothetical protein
MVLALIELALRSTFLLLFMLSIIGIVILFNLDYDKFLTPLSFELAKSLSQVDG